MMKSFASDVYNENENNLLMNHLGGMVAWFMLSGSQDPYLWIFLVYLTCGWPPRTKEIGPVSSEVASSAATWQYGLCLDGVCCMIPA